MIAASLATEAGPGIHPRILARMKLVALSRRQDMVLTELDELIARLQDLSPSTDRFQAAAEHARTLRQQTVYIRVGTPRNLALLDEIRQHIAATRAAIAAVGIVQELVTG
jgi:hypothetical protein